MVRKVRFKCIKCGNCCRDKNTIVTITNRDTIRLVNHLKCDLKELLQKYVGFYQVRKELENRLVFPAISTFRGNAFLGLRKKDDGSCVFLKGNLCGIYEGRPMVCRSFPFVFEVKEGWLSWGLMARAENICLGLGQGKRISEKNLEILGKQVIEELEQYRKIVSAWNKQEKAEQLDPTLLVSSFLEEAKLFPSQ